MRVKNQPFLKSIGAVAPMLTRSLCLNMTLNTHCWSLVCFLAPQHPEQWIDPWLLSVASVDSLSLSGPQRLNKTGKNITPWKRPKATVRRNTLKKVIKTWDFENPKSKRARKVVIPPLMTAGPIFKRLLTARSSLLPCDTIKAWAMCAE